MQPRLRRRGWVGLFCLCASFLVCLVGCREQRRAEPVTLRYFRLGWSQPDEIPTAEPLTARFEKETGLRLKNLPVPETSLAQLNLSRTLLKSEDRVPDVLGIDIIWLGTLKGSLLDLRPYVSDLAKSLTPELVRDYTVDGKLVAVPYAAQTGVLEYRTDLLRKYGFARPPRTWDELEVMARRIQDGEHKEGNKNFWGYVWQGAPAESLTCNGLEWQAADGAGRIIEDDHTVSVNNPATVRAWERAARWIGRISPPGVVFYHESDSSNMYDAGNAAFNRVWGGAPITPTGHSSQMHWRASLTQEKTGYTTIPGGSGGSGAALGGSGLGIAANSRHREEAVKLLRFLLQAQIKASQVEEQTAIGQPEISERTRLSGVPASDRVPAAAGDIVSRPSSVTGQKYEQVSTAYFSALHSVLTRERPASAALAKLQQDLVAITGFSARAPKP